MRAAKLVNPGKIAIEEIPEPSIGDNDVKICVKFCGICGSDIAAYQGIHPFISPPIILGHEVVGVIEEIGKSVEGFEVGDRVTIEPLITCGKCYNCKSGVYNRCEKIKVIGCQIDGGFCEHIKVDFLRVYKLPNGIPFEVGALTEPLAVAFHALSRGSPFFGENVVIIGDGTIGLLIAMLSQLNGCNTTLVGISDKKLKFAKEVLRIPYVINSKEENTVKIIRDIYADSGVDFVFECVGHTQETIKQAIQLVRRGGIVVVVGVFHESIPVDVGYVQDKEITLLGTLVYTFKDFYNAINVMGRDDVKEKILKFITRIYPLEKADDAFRFILNNRDEAIKVLLRV